MAEEIPDASSGVPTCTPEQSSTEDKAINGKVNHEHYQADPEAQGMVVESLRSQIQDLFSQVTQLNAKLVKSYDRVSDLEDNLHVASAQLRTSSVKVSQLELERTQHLAALNTGLLVEKHHVTTELNRLMEKATEEAAQRGQAESARVAIEKELDDLSASLFNQANTMVAEARYAQHVSDRKANDAEQALKGAEEAVSLMQQQVQALQEEKEIAERKTTEMQSLVGKGKWVERRDSQGPTPPLRLFNSHVPYQEFIFFVAHLRHLHTTSSNVPAMSTLLPLPFLTRLSTEDSEPTVRLDLAPSLNWLSRRSVLAAVHNGQLTIEPMSLATLLTEFSHLPNTGISGHSNNENIPCALCGMPIFPQAPSTNTSPSRPPSHPLRGIAQPYQGSGSWSANFFKKTPSGINTSIPSLPSIPSRSAAHTTQTPSSSPIYPSQIYIFRISTIQTSALPQLPLIKSTALSASGMSTPIPSYQPAPALSHSSLSNGAAPNSSSTIYPICSTSWCLTRLRATCSLWAFVRTGIVEKIWEEEIPIVLPPTVRSRVSSSVTLVSDSTNSVGGPGTAEKPPVPPRKRGLWGLASAVGEKAASWGGKSAVASEKEKEEGKVLPPPPALPAREPAAPSATSAPSVAPPPLPKRSEGRARTPTNQPSPSPEPAPVEPPTKSAPLDQPPPREIPPVEPLEHKPVSSALPSELAVEKDEASTTTTSETPTPAATVTATPTPPQAPTRTQPPTSAPTPPPAIPPRAVKRLSASLARPGTPSSIPLPDSRPGTPPVAFPGGATPNPPSRTASPALGGGGSPSTPPPLPRRAAARTPRRPDSRPGSPAIIASSTTAVVPGSPLKSGDVQAQAQVITPVQLGSVKEAVEETKEETKKADAPVIQPKSLEVSKPPMQIARTESGISASENEVFVDAEEGLPGEKEGEGERGGKEKQTEVLVDKESKETKESPKDNDITQGETKQEETKDALEGKTRDQQNTISLNDGELPPPVSAVAPPPVPPRSRPTKGEVPKVEIEKEEDEAKDTDSADENESDAQNYVSDATWEERTWRELTRLREEMFWARIGAIRS